ncbi:MAG: ABC transporter [Desulfobulbaceae bacterium]|nr:MAG: ABC transporter [Desulfobulbaceae bacterium]
MQTTPPITRSILLLCSFFLCFGAGCSRTTEEEKTYSIGVINFSKAAEPAFHGFRQGMTERGYREGLNIRYLYQGHLTDKDKLLAEAARLLAAEVDLIFAMTTPASLAAKKVTAGTAIPVVFGPVSNPVASGLVTNLKEPGGNLTGITFSQQEPKRLEFFKNTLPSIKRICVPYNSKDLSPTRNLETLAEAAAKLAVELVPVSLHTNAEIDAFLADFPAGFDAIYLPTDSLIASRVNDFAALAIARKLPLATPHKEGVAAGGLLSYGFSTFAVGRQAAHLADQILRGTRPANLPVEVTEFSPTINLATARKIGVTIPDTALRQALIIRD